MEPGLIVRPSSVTRVEPSAATVAQGHAPSGEHGAPGHDPIAGDVVESSERIRDAVRFAAGYIAEGTADARFVGALRQMQGAPSRSELERCERVRRGIVAEKSRARKNAFVDGAALVTLGINASASLWLTGRTAALAGMTSRAQGGTAAMWGDHAAALFGVCGGTGSSALGVYAFYHMKQRMIELAELEKQRRVIDAYVRRRSPQAAGAHAA